MPLPTDSKTAWPPASSVAGDLAQWGAWYSGSSYDLTATVESSQGVGLSGYVRGLWRRKEKLAKGGSPASTVEPLHVPLASEIAAVSADLLFGEFPELTVEDDDAQARFAELVDLGDLQSVMLEAAEVTALTAWLNAHTVTAATNSFLTASSGSGSRRAASSSSRVCRLMYSACTRLCSCK